MTWFVLRRSQGVEFEGMTKGESRGDGELKVEGLGVSNCTV